MKVRDLLTILRRMSPDDDLEFSVDILSIPAEEYVRVFCDTIVGVTCSPSDNRMIMLSGDWNRADYRPELPPELTALVLPVIAPRTRTLL